MNRFALLVASNHRAPHPVDLQIMSPLSKELGTTGKSQRFELFVNGVELANSYTEQNDPLKQERSFLMQAEQRKTGDTEIPPTDSAFIDVSILVNAAPPDRVPHPTHAMCRL